MSNLTVEFSVHSDIIHAFFLSQNTGYLKLDTVITEPYSFFSMWNLLQYNHCVG